MARRATQQAANAHQLKEGASLEQMAATAKAERGQRCADELQAATKAICEKHNCDPVVMVQIGNELRPLVQVLLLPITLMPLPLDVAPAKVESPSLNGNGIHKDN